MLTLTVFNVDSGKTVHVKMQMMLKGGKGKVVQGTLTIWGLHFTFANGIGEADREMEGQSYFIRAHGFPMPFLLLFFINIL